MSTEALSLRHFIGNVRGIWMPCTSSAMHAVGLWSSTTVQGMKWKGMEYWNPNYFGILRKLSFHDHELLHLLLLVTSNLDWIQICNLSHCEPVKTKSLCIWRLCAAHALPHGASITNEVLYFKCGMHLVRDSTVEMMPGLDIAIWEEMNED